MQSKAALLNLFTTVFTNQERIDNWMLSWQFLFIAQRSSDRFETPKNGSFEVRVTASELGEVHSWNAIFIEDLLKSKDLAVDGEQFEQFLPLCLRHSCHTTLRTELSKRANLFRILDAEPAPVYKVLPDSVVGGPEQDEYWLSVSCDAVAQLSAFQP